MHDGDVVLLPAGCVQSASCPTTRVAPLLVQAADITSVGPFESRTKVVDGQVAVFPETITVQATDLSGQTWIWTPEASTLTPTPPPRTPLARVVQFSYRYFPEWLRKRFVRLPDRALVFLWGHHPSTEMGVTF